MKVLVLDNYDSFVYILVQYIGELGGKPTVYRNDKLTLNQSKKLGPDRIVISPGPGIPYDERYFGVCSSILRHMSNEIPTLGVCLGHQGIISTFGGRIIRAKRLMHGKTSVIKHDGHGVFKSLKNPLVATRYHSLLVERASLPAQLSITAETDEGEIMGLQHVELPVYGVQFHPESILTEQGMRIVHNFLEL